MCDCQWRGIETAPKDGSRVLLWSSYGFRIGEWHLGSGWLSLNYGQPTYWMPLQPPGAVAVSGVAGDDPARSAEEPSS